MGDYAQMSVDPNGRTFWFTTEYVKSNTHGTRIVAFEFPQNCTPPSTQASNFRVYNIDANSVDISWSRGNGDRVLVVAREGSAVNADPVSGTAYTANATFGYGDQTGSGNYVVYNGTGTSVHVTGLYSATTYYFAVYEFNAADDCYLIPALTGNATTAGPPSVQTVSVSNVTTTTADAQGEVISENGSAITERGFCWSTSVNPTLSDNHLAAGSGTGNFTATLTGLNANTTYYVRAYAVNGNGTAYGDNISFATECGLVTDFPYLESFNPMAESNPGTDCTPDGSVPLMDCWQNLTGDDSDWDIISGATPSTGTGPFFDANDWPGKYIYLEASSCTGKTASFESPAFDFSNLSNPELRFNYHMFGTDMGSLDVSISTDNGSTWTNIRSVSGDQGMEWHEAIVDLSAYAGENNVHFKFTGNTGSSYLSDIAVDNIIVQEATGISSYRNYCSMSGNMDYGTALTGVAFNQIYVGSGKSAPYENFMQISTELQKGQTYQLHTYVDTDGNYDVYVRAWIDWNQDGDFDDSGEEYDLGYATDVSQGETSLSPLDIQVPTNAKNGFTRMRIAAKYNSYPSMCETDFDGETEDYGIIVFDNRCNSVARWNGTLWKTPAGDTLTTADLNGRFFQTDNLLYLKNNDLHGCSVEIGKGKTLVVGVDHALQVTYDVFNHGFLEIRNNASLVQSNDNSVIQGNGKYVMKRISDSLYHYYNYAYWSSPLNSSAFTLGDLENNAWKYYYFDATIQDPSQISNSGWVERQANDVFQTGSGYAVSAPNGFPGGIIKAVFQKNNDPFNNGAIQVPVYINGQGASGNDDWNLLGNPYPSALDFDQFVNNNPNIEGSLYLWTNCAGLDANGQHQESGYSIYNQSGSIAACSGNGSTAGQFVASGQGFMVEANTNGTVTFSNTERSTNNNHFLNRISQDRVKIHLTDENNHRFRQILIAFDQAATDGHDRLYDAHAIDDAWFAIQNNNDYSIIAYSAWNDMDRTVPLGFRAPADGNYEIALDEVTGALQNIHIYLHDIPNNVYYPLNNGAYTFYSSAGLHTGRFEILFTTQTLKTDNDKSANDKIRLLRDDEGHFILRDDKEVITSAKVYNTNGRLLKTQKGNGTNTLRLNLQQIPRQTLLFQIFTSGDHIYFKKTIR